MNNYDDILISHGDKPNFLTNELYSDEYKETAKYWSKLPIYTDKEKTKIFFNLLKNKQVILLTSGTGSGKTVIIPKYFLKYIIDNNISGKIAITNPKIITTLSNAQYSAKTLDVKLGNEVGYKYKGASSKSVSDKTKLIYMTDGLLLSIITNNDKYLSEYAGVIIDEAHERQIQIDLLLKLIKEVLFHRKDFKLIIMSATINSQVFKNYFDIKNINYGELDIYGGSNYPIERIWSNANSDNYNYLKKAIETCNNIIKKSIKNNDNNDIIIFVPTQLDTINGCNLITDSNKNLFCVEVFSNISDKQKELAISKELYKKDGNYNIKVIFATNVAESSITFDGLKYVIDTGLELVNEFDSRYNMSIVKKDYTTQAQIIQRIGRTGRTAPGIAYHLYTESKFNSLLDFPKPNILTMDLTEYILSLIQYSKTTNNLIKLLNDLITPPTKYQIENSLHKLKFTKCIKTNKDNNSVLTSLGINILNFKSISLLSALAIIMSYYLYCQKEMIIIIAIIETTEGKLDTLFKYDKNEEKKVKNYFQKYSYPNSDHLTMLNIYLELYKNNEMKYLKKDMFNKINKQIKLLKHYSRKINNEKYKYINNKYKLIQIKPYNKIEKNLLYILAKSHSYNLIENNSTINFINNSKARIEFSKITFINKEKNKKSICYGLTEIFNRKIFRCVTHIPNFIKNI